MIKHPLVRRAGVHRRGRVVRMVLSASLAVFGSVSSAPASEHHPTGDYAPFADCPLSDLSLNTCLVGEITSGGFIVGKKTVPIDKTLTLQGGLVQRAETPQLTLVAAEDGNTLSKTALSVPGGLLGVVAPAYLPRSLRSLFENTVNRGLTSVTLTAELAKPASAAIANLFNLLFESGVALSLPLKVKLSNPFLGNNCYIGSFSYPILLNLTTGATSPPSPNKPIRGASSKLELLDGFELGVLASNSLVDNAFAVPQASGCGGSYSTSIDPAVDAAIGLPSAAGHNTAILNAKLELSAAEAVREHE